MSSHLPTTVPQRLSAVRRLGPSTTSILGRRKRSTLLTDLPDDILIKIIQYALQMSPRRPGEVSRRVRPRFQTVGRVIAQISRRFHMLLRQAITSLRLKSYPPHSWLNAMLVFAQSSLVSLSLVAENSAFCALAQHASRLCLMLASTHPPLRSIVISSLSPAPFEHVVSLLRALPSLRAINLITPRPVDVAAITHACPLLRSLTLGSIAHHSEVDEMRRQFSKLLASPTARSLTSLSISWCCCTVSAFKAIGANCHDLEKLSVELGTMYWIRHSRYIRKHAQLGFSECYREQRTLFNTMVKAIADGRLKTFEMRSLDGIPCPELEDLFNALSGLSELDIRIGPWNSMRVCPEKIFDKLTQTLGKTLVKVNIVGMRFNAEQVSRFSTEYPHLRSIRIWMVRNERPSVDIFEALGERIRHLSLLCDWNEEMCAAVGKHNTKLESLFLVTAHLPLKSISTLLTGICFTLKEFQLFFNSRRPQHGEADQLEMENQTEMGVIVHSAARMIAKACASNLEVLNISALAWNGYCVVDCTTIASELRETAPHLHQICHRPIFN